MNGFQAVSCVLLIFLLAVPLLLPGVQARNPQNISFLKKSLFEELAYPSNVTLSQSMEQMNNQRTYVAQGESLKVIQYNTCGLLNSSWPMASHDTRHTGLSPYSTADSPGIIKWRLSVDPYPIDGGIAIDKNGTLYFGSNDDYMNAAYPNGTMKWRYHVTELTGGWIESTPAIASDGTIYVGCWNCYLYAFNPNGTKKWCHHCGSTISYGSPAIADDGTIYVTTMDSANSLVAVNPDGTEKWRYQTGQWLTSAPVIGLDGTIFFGSSDTYIYAVNSNGTLRWRHKTGDYVMGSASIAADGTVYIASYDGFLYALNPVNGSLIWRCDIGMGSKVNPSIGPDGNIYIGEGYLYSITPNGTIRWQINLWGGIGWSSPAISADGIIYVGTHIGDDGGGKIYAINPNGTERWEQLLVWHGHIDSSPAIAADGTVYIGSANGDGLCYLYAFGRGPLNVEANGPYTGYYNTAIHFTGDAFGGTPPYSFHWDFGDSQTSDQQNPTHNYTTAGNFTATFTVTDTEGNHSSDTTSVHITYTPVTVSITKPTRGLYIMDTRVLPLPSKCIAIGPITIEAQASQIPLGIDRVEFRLDDNLKATVTQPPYTWRWNHGLFAHTVTVIAYDTSGRSASASIQITKFF